MLSCCWRRGGNRQRFGDGVDSEEGRRRTDAADVDGGEIAQGDLALGRPELVAPEDVVVFEVLELPSVELSSRPAEDLGTEAEGSRPHLPKPCVTTEKASASESWKG
jgi:hypothetical protein